MMIPEGFRGTTHKMQWVFKRGSHSGASTAPLRGASSEAQFPASTRSLGSHLSPQLPSEAPALSEAPSLRVREPPPPPVDLPIA